MNVQSCPATAEAVLEREDFGEVGCPLCGRAAYFHTREDGLRPQHGGAVLGFGIGDCPSCDLPFGHSGQHEDIYAHPDPLATPEEQGLTPGGERL